MLDEYKKIYEESANNIDNWRNISTIDLADNYIKTGEDKYLSAIICKYWYLIPMYYKKQEYKFASEEDCYSWLVDTIMYVIKNHVWTDPDSSLYNDLSGPDKAIIVCFTRERLRFYGSTKKDKRIANNKSVRLSQLDLPEQTEEQFFDSLIKREHKELSDDLENYTKQKIIILFKNKEYFDAFTLYGILTYNLYDVDENNNIFFNEKKLKKYLHNIKFGIYKIFSQDYNLNIDIVKKSLKYISDIDGENFNNNLFRFRKSLLKDKIFMEYFNL